MSDKTTTGKESKESSVLIENANPWSAMNLRPCDPYSPQVLPTAENESKALRELDECVNTLRGMDNLSVGIPYYPLELTNFKPYDYAHPAYTSGDTTAVGHPSIGYGNSVICNTRTLLSPAAKNILSGIECTTSNVLPKDNSNNKSEGKNMKNEAILNLWKKTVVEKLSKFRQDYENELMSKDSVHIEINSLVKQLNDRLKSDDVCTKNPMYKSLYDIPSGLLVYSKDTINALGELNKEYEQAYAIFQQTYEEVVALLSACETYDQELDVLISYGIMTRTADTIKFNNNWANNFGIMNK